ncbi:hypothetical protein [Streptomyces sp. 8N616]
MDTAVAAAQDASSWLIEGFGLGLGLLLGLGLGLAAADCRAPGSASA